MEKDGKEMKFVLSKVRGKVLVSTLVFYVLLKMVHWNDFVRLLNKFEALKKFKN